MAVQKIFTNTFYILLSTMLIYLLIPKYKILSTPNPNKLIKYNVFTGDVWTSDSNSKWVEVGVKVESRSTVMDIAEKYQRQEQK